MHTRPTSKRSYHYAALCGLAMGTAIGTSLVITQRMASRHRMPNLKVWRRALIDRHGEVQGAILAARVQARYEALYGERPSFTHPMLRWHLGQNILPGLALYQVLRKDSSDRDAALAETGSLLAIGATPRALRRVMRLLAYLPQPFALFRQILKLSLLAYPRQGWAIEQGEQGTSSFAFTVSRCFYLDILTAYGAPELTPLYCQLDDLAYADVSPSIRWERTKTLGRGDDRCDFRWSRAEPGQGTSRLIQVKWETR